mmetsp:Transcript_57777/g.165728  ORF Transcript_57777/g.165728 Transcript_57777/m.165728 type:complete len:217 (+) Transcript_57777:138-788(+)
MQAARARAPGIGIHVAVHLVGLLPLHALLLLDADAHAADQTSVEVDRVQLVVAVRVERAEHLLDVLRSLLGADDAGDVLEVLEGDRARRIVVEELEDAHDIIDLVLRAQLGGHPLEELFEANLVVAQQDGNVLLHGDAQGDGGALELLGVDEAAAVLVDHVEGALHVHDLVHRDLARDAVSRRVEGGGTAHARVSLLAIHCGRKSATKGGRLTKQI